MGFPLIIGTSFRNSRCQWEDDRRNPDVPLNITFVVQLKRTHVADGLPIRNVRWMLPECSLSLVGNFGYPSLQDKEDKSGPPIPPEKIAEKLINRRSEPSNPHAIWLNIVSNHIYLAIAEHAVVQVVDARGLAVIETPQTGPGAHTLALDAKRQELYVFCPSTCSVRAYTVSRS